MSLPHFAASTGLQIFTPKDVEHKHFPYFNISDDRQVHSTGALQAAPLSSLMLSTPALQPSMCLSLWLLSLRQPQNVLCTSLFLCTLQHRIYVTHHASVPPFTLLVCTAMQYKMFVEKLLRPTKPAEAVHYFQFDLNLQSMGVVLDFLGPK